MSPYEVISSLVRARSGLVLGSDKLYLMETRLAPILQKEGLRDLAMLADYLRSPTQAAHGAELMHEVVEAMTTNETLFFRDIKIFKHLRQQVLPRLHRSRQAGKPFRIWSAAASTGQEAYSVAMTFAESRDLLPGRRAEILGTDIAREPIQRAREGRYSQFEVQRGTPVQLLIKYFEKEGDGWKVKDDLRTFVQFLQWNLLEDISALGTFDVVFCRNVLIYFDNIIKTRVLSAIARRLAPDGVLYLGSAETVLGLTTEFTPLATDRGVYMLDNK